MAASRASSLRALNRIAAGSGQVRKIHITGPTTFPSPLLTTERPAVNLPKDLAGLRDECQKRSLPTVGSKQELIDRITADELIQTRGFSTAISSDKRPAVSEADAYMALPPSSSSSSQPVRHFNTSRSLKAINDSSTIDFAYFPDFDPDIEGPAPTLRVPLLPQSVLRGGKSTAATAADEAEAEVMRPTIVTASADSTHVSAPSAMSELHDNAAVDVGHMAERVAAAGTKQLGGGGAGVGAPSEESQGMVRTVLKGMLEDIMGPAKPTKS